jgi:hypothetical protein
MLVFLLVAVGFIAVPNALAPKNSAEQVAVEYLKAILRCDYKKANTMRLDPLPEQKKKCEKTIRTSGGQEIPVSDVAIGIAKSDYSNEKHPEIDPEGKIESAVILPSITYQGKPVVDLPMFVMLTKNPDLADKWLVLSP